MWNFFLQACQKSTFYGNRVEHGQTPFNVIQTNKNIGFMNSLCIHI